ncbi:MAG: nitrate reductase associated protein [Pedobacter sp.]|nr:nitrate reductase associated protein [Chitinophagaceae bacterium]
METSFENSGFISYPPLGAGGFAGGVVYFAFEADFIEDNVRCIPMIARFKLDACGIKLSLKQWSKMSVIERNLVAEFDCSSQKKLNNYKAYLQAVILNRTGEIARQLEVEQNPQWAETLAVPAIVTNKCAELNINITLESWLKLDYLQRFVLVKLSKPSHENRNFPIAMEEFGLF